ncbi:MAG TPA: hypothetical protein VII72_03430 [Myxococcota bacterium]|jgi:hypothetical protein
MPVRHRRVVPAVLVLLVLFASQAAYAAQAQGRPSGHCAGTAPPTESCPLPLWLTCCDDRAAVGTALNGPGPGSLLVLPLDSELGSVLPATRTPIARRAEIPPDTPLSRFAVLLI